MIMFDAGAIKYYSPRQELFILLKWYLLLCQRAKWILDHNYFLYWFFLITNSTGNITVSPDYSSVQNNPQRLSAWHSLG